MLVEMVEALIKTFGLGLKALLKVFGLRLEVLINTLGLRLKALLRTLALSFDHLGQYRYILPQPGELLSQLAA